MDNKQIRIEDLAIDEYRKCKNDPCYFYNKYWKVFDRNGNEISKPELTQKQFSDMVELNKRLIRQRNHRTGYYVTWKQYPM